MVSTKTLAAGETEWPCSWEKDAHGLWNEATGLASIPDAVSRKKKAVSQMYQRAFVLQFATVVFLAGSAQAMPLAPVVQPAQPGLAIHVADGCGINRYRDSRGVCRRKYVLGRYQGKTSLYGACGGVNSHRVCNLYGQCWMVCD
jgi:hypothetical protein